MIPIRSALNYLVIAIMVFMTAITAVFVYVSFDIKDKMILRTVQQTEFASELLARASSELMREGHSTDNYRAILDYGEIIGIEDVGILKPDGEPATFGLAAPGMSGFAGLKPPDRDAFGQAASAGYPSGYFDGDSEIYTRFVPLRNDGACLKCHSGDGGALGFLMLRLSTSGDLELLGFMQKLIWVLGGIVLLPACGLMVAGAVIKEKNRIFGQLKSSKDELQRTYDELDQTKYYLQMILDNSRVLIVTTDMQGRIVEFNREAESILEYAKEEAVGRDVLMLYDSPRQRTEVMKGAVVTEGSLWEVRNREVRLRSRSGRVIHVSLTLSTLNDRGRIVGTVGVGKDITEQKMLQFKLMQSEKLAGIGTLATGIAHEINNPLAGILGMAEAIREESDMTLIKSHTEDIIQYSENARRIVRELSDYSRAAQNTVESRVDLSKTIENSLKLARHSASFGAIEVDSALEGGSFVHGSQVELQQVFVNLIINAVHAMEGGGALTLRCWKEGPFVKAVVADSGHGIPEEKMNQIFDPFFTTKPVGAGTGLGLYVVYRIVTKYGGGIDVESAEGRGTAFTVKFPATGGLAAADDGEFIASSESKSN
ncbi:MAG TPA: ATP-binding protein [Thermodesulfobacteriota bacterium]